MPKDGLGRIGCQDSLSQAPPPACCRRGWRGSPPRRWCSWRRKCPWCPRFRRMRRVRRRGQMQVEPCGFWGLLQSSTVFNWFLHEYGAFQRNCLELVQLVSPLRVSLARKPLPWGARHQKSSWGARCGLLWIKRCLPLAFQKV